MEKEIDYTYLANRYEVLTSQYGLVHWNGDKGTLDEEFVSLIYRYLDKINDFGYWQGLLHAVTTCVISHCKQSSLAERRLICLGLLASLSEDNENIKTFNPIDVESLLVKMEQTLRSEEALV